MEKTIDVINLRHIYAPLGTSQKGHICMPTSNLTAMARIEAAGVSTSFFDENFRPYEGLGVNVAVGLVGAISISGALDLYKRIQGRARRQAKLILGGQVLKSLSETEFLNLFPDGNILNGNGDELFGKMPTPENTSLVAAYERVPDDMMAEYLQNEIPFYLSQGCKYGCAFCAACKQRPEQYRDLGQVEKDLEWLVNRAERLFEQGKLSHRELSFYLSNLDTFQTPKLLGQFAEVVKRIKKNHIKDAQEFSLKMRGLSTVFEFLIAVEKHPNVVKNMVEAGFHTVGFGIDGMTAAVWKKIGKAHNYRMRNLKIKRGKEDLSAEQSIQETELSIAAIQKAREFGIIPELLMVFGHIDPKTLDPIDTEESMSLAYEFLREMQENHGAIPRPQVVKPYPGNEMWESMAFKPIAESIVCHPEAFQALDFVARANPISHQDETFRQRVNFWLDQMSALGKNHSQVIEPIDLDFKDVEVKILKLARSRLIHVVTGIPRGAWEKMIRANEGKFDR